MILVLEERFGSPYSIDIKIPVALYFTFQKPNFTDLRQKYADFQIFAKNPRNMRNMSLLHTQELSKFQVHSTNIFVFVATPSTPNFDSLPYPYLRVGWHFLLSL